MKINCTAFILASILTVSVAFLAGALPPNYLLSGYVDPANPGMILIRWTQISGAATTPPVGSYKITLTQ